MKAVLILVALATVVASSPASHAAVLRTVAGAEVTGELTSEMFRIRTAAGEVEIPKGAILQIKRTGSGFEFLLADGTKFAGAIVESSVRLKVGLVYQVVPSTEIDVLMLTPAGFPVGSLDSAFFPAAKYQGLEPIAGCPIRFELEANAALHAPEGTGWRVPKTRHFTCDSLSITSLILTVDRTKKVVKLDFDGAASVLESFDKWARVTIELSASGEILKRGQKTAIDAEERKTTRFSIGLEVPPDEIDAALASGEPLLVRVTVDVGRNGDVEYLQGWGATMKGPKYENQPPPPN